MKKKMYYVCSVKTFAPNHLPSFNLLFLFIHETEYWYQILRISSNLLLWRIISLLIYLFLISNYKCKYLNVPRYIYIYIFRYTELFWYNAHESHRFFILLYIVIA